MSELETYGVLGFIVVLTVRELFSLIRHVLSKKEDRTEEIYQMLKYLQEWHSRTGENGRPLAYYPHLQIQKSFDRIEDMLERVLERLDVVVTHHEYWEKFKGGK